MLCLLYDRSNLPLLLWHTVQFLLNLPIDIKRTLSLRKLVNIVFFYTSRYILQSQSFHTRPLYLGAQWFLFDFRRPYQYFQKNNVSKARAIKSKEKREGRRQTTNDIPGEVESCTVGEENIIKKQCVQEVLFTPIQPLFLFVEGRKTRWCTNIMTSLR